MFASAPAPRDGETLYSVIARYGRYLNVAEAGPLMAELLGRRHAIASVDLPGNLSVLTRGLPAAERDGLVDRIVDDLTVFPFHTAFVHAEVRGEVRQAMRGDVTGIYTRLGLAAFKVRPPDRLRFCPECLDAMEQDLGDPWWRREHQLPGVFVCFEHDCALRMSDVNPGDRLRHSFVAAERGVCRDDAELATDAGAVDLQRMAGLARAAVAILRRPPDARVYGSILSDHRAALADVGLMRSPMKVDHTALLSAFRDRWGTVPEMIPGMGLDPDPERSWLAALVRNGRRAAHPLQHLMLQGMLDGMASVPVDRPFGLGPWLCRNPLSGHHGEAVIEGVQVRRDRGTIYGDFVCSCGYLYTVGVSESGEMGRPKYRRFGPLLAPAVKAGVERGDGLRKTAAAVGLDPKTLIREAATAGIDVPWSTAASGRVPEAVASVQRVPHVSVAPRACRGMRRNWFAIDARLTRAVKTAAEVIAGEAPPVRVTFAEMERRVARADWVVKRRAKLPRTVVAIATLVEDVDVFRHRRLAWQVREATAQGDLRPCEVLRAAGLPMKWLPIVREAIADIGFRGRAVA